MCVCVCLLVHVYTVYIYIYVYVYIITYVYIYIYIYIYKENEGKKLHREPEVWLARFGLQWTSSQAATEYYRGLDNYPYYFGDYGIIYPRYRGRNITNTILGVPYYK